MTGTEFTQAGVRSLMMDIKALHVGLYQEVTERDRGYDVDKARPMLQTIQFVYIG